MRGFIKGSGRRSGREAHVPGRVSVAWHGARLRWDGKEEIHGILDGSTRTGARKPCGLTVDSDLQLIGQSLHVPTSCTPSALFERRQDNWAHLHQAQPGRGAMAACRRSLGLRVQSPGCLESEDAALLVSTFTRHSGAKSMARRGTLDASRTHPTACDCL